MGTCRSGSVDPGLLIDLIAHHGLSPDAVREGLEHRSGLLGLSGGESNDTRDLYTAAQKGDGNARLALEVFCLHVRQGIAQAAVSLEHLDALVFTGEISNDQPQLLQAVCAGLRPLGIAGDLRDVRGADAVLSGAEASIPVIALTVEEDLQIAAETRRVLDRSSGSQES